MLDFLMISTRTKRQGVVEVYPKFIVKKSKDLMIRGGDFYAIWVEDQKLWSTNEEDAIRMIDEELDNFAKDQKNRFGNDHIVVLNMWDSDSGMIDNWHKYCQKQLRDNHNQLDSHIVFSSDETKRSDHASKKLPYSLEPNGNIDSYNELITTLYSDDERHKIEWCVGAIITGASKNIQKFAVLYGPPGSGKSTVLNIIQLLFEGYYSVFDADSLGSASDSFSLEQFKQNPLVAISHDGDLSRIEKNTRLNSLVSHERMVVNEKHKSFYSMRFNSFLFMGTNKPVKITDAKSGLIRRLIDIHPTGNKVPQAKYNRLMKQIEFELGAIASHCERVYLEDIHAYDDYKPTDMMGESNDFYNFVGDSYLIFKKENGVSLKSAWEMYKVYCEQAKVQYPMTMRIFKNELKSYFKEYEERVRVGEDYIRSYYSGFRDDIFNIEPEPKKRRSKKVSEEDITELIEFIEQPSKLDIICQDCSAQYGYETGRGAPQEKWVNVTTKLSDIDTSRLHYLKVPENHIVIDFDLTDDNGEKSLEKNLVEASKWPKTYSELSKSGKGIHLHYIYSGDATQLSRVYASSIEIKVFTGNSSLRRKLTKCNNLDIATISSGLPMKEGGKVINFEAVTNEKALRTIIKKNFNKEYHSATKPSMDFIFKVLEDAYTSGIKYDVTDLHGAMVAFASSSTNQADYCLKLIPKMKFKSEEASTSVNNDENQIAFFDIEVFKNLCLVNWKFRGKDKKMNRLINPKAKDIEPLLKHRLVGFNCRRYDNHILYGIYIGYDNAQIYDLSKKLIGSDRKAPFNEAYNISYTDIYEYTTKKQSLKKWEIELKIKHKELGMDWDKEVPEHLWPMVSEYCDNDVLATEELFEHTQADFRAKQILAEIAGGTVNDTKNQLTTNLIFGKEKKPKLNYVDLALEFPGYEFVKVWNDKTKRFDKFNMYRGVDLGFGGYVKANPGMYGNTALLDVASMHPNSAIAMNYFGDYTPIFKELVDARVYIKHGDFEKAKKLFNGRLAKYLDDETMIDELADALKIPINSVYGLTSASFDNAFRDYRNENNIVALRGALFMKTLEDEVEARGFTVAHIKTDSIKIPDATKEIIDFCKDFGKKYGYDFEHEATYDRITLVNDAVYIAKYDKYGVRTKRGKYKNEWVAVGTQFAVPYVFKTLFSKEPIVFDDLCETKEVSKSSIFLSFNEDSQSPVEEESLRFIGRVGLFTPIKENCGGASLVKPVEKKDGSIAYDSVTGTKGYKWLESAEVQEKNLFDSIDYSYYNKLVDGAIDSINKYGDFEWLVGSEPYIKISEK